MSNPCIRCGNQRVFHKTWEEVNMVYGKEITTTYTNFVCPDSKCQKIVEEQLRAQKEKKESFDRHKELEKQNRSRRLAEAKNKVTSS